MKRNEQLKEKRDTDNCNFDMKFGREKIKINLSQKDKTLNKSQKAGKDKIF